MNKFKTFLFLFGLFSILSAKELSVYVDQNRFFDESENTIIEINYQVQYNELEFIRTELGFEASLKVNYALEKKDKIIFSDEFSNKIILKNQEIINSPKGFNDKVIFTLSKSGFKIIINFTDTNTGNSMSWDYDFEVLPAGSLVSDIEFSNEIKIDSTNFMQKFHRGQYLFLVNPKHIFTNLQKNIFLYYELGNFKQDNAGNCNLSETISIINNDGENIQEITNNIIEKKGKIAAIKKININNYDSGYYELILKIEDKIENKLTVKKDYFSVKIPKIMEKRMFVNIESEYKLIKYFLSSSQIKVWRSLSENGKKNFIDRFWFSNDPDPTTEENEFYELIKERMKYCNEHFSYFSDGWETDRGRIYIRNGKSDEILKCETGLYTKYAQKEYHIWKYRTKVNRTYIFLDMQSAGNYKIIYADNDESENTISNWKDHLGKDFDEGLLE